MSFIDSGYIFVYFLKNKSDAAKATEKFLADIAPYGNLERLRSDNGTEYTSNEFEKLMIINKIRHEYTAPYPPHQNGKAERSWRSIFKMTRCLLLESKLPKEFWNYAVRMSAHIRNRCFSKVIGMTPLEGFSGEKPDIQNMKIL